MSKPSDDPGPRFSISEDQPTKWFEMLYSGADRDGVGVPWANMETHPSFIDWIAQNELSGAGKTALVVGCGMGDDAIELEAHGFQVTAFDVSDSAIAYCKERFPEAKVEFLQADLLEDQPQWLGKFDFVLEIFTVQALPPKYEDKLVKRIASFVAPGGRLVVIAETSQETRDFEKGPPWLLTPDHIDRFATAGLTLESEIAEASDFEGADKLMTTTFRRPGR